MLETEWTGGQLRDAGMAEAENAADPRVIVIIDGLIAAWNSSGVAWSANDIRKHLPVASRGLVGARVRAAAQRRPREMVHTGRYVKSNLPSTRNAEIKVWRGVE